MIACDIIKGWEDKLTSFIPKEGIIRPRSPQVRSPAPPVVATPQHRARSTWPLISVLGVMLCCVVVAFGSSLDLFKKIFGSSYSEEGKIMPDSKPESVLSQPIWAKIASLTGLTAKADENQKRRWMIQIADQFGIKFGSEGFQPTLEDLDKALAQSGAANAWVRAWSDEKFTRLDPRLDAWQSKDETLRDDVLRLKNSSPFYLQKTPNQLATMLKKWQAALLAYSKEELTDKAIRKSAEQVLMKVDALPASDLLAETRTELLWPSDLKRWELLHHWLMNDPDFNEAVAVYEPFGDKMWASMSWDDRIKAIQKLETKKIGSTEKVFLVNILKASQEFAQ